MSYAKYWSCEVQTRGDIQIRMKTVLNIAILALYGAILWTGIRADKPASDIPTQADTIMAALSSAENRPPTQSVRVTYYSPTTLRERVAAASEACTTGWGNLPDPVGVTPHGGAPMDGEYEDYGCVATDPERTSLFAVMRYQGGDRTQPDSYRLIVVCDGLGAIIQGTDARLCETSPL